MKRWYVMKVAWLADWLVDWLTSYFIAQHYQCQSWDSITSSRGAQGQEAQALRHWRWRGCCWQCWPRCSWSKEAL